MVTIVPHSIVRGATPCLAELTFRIPNTEDKDWITVELPLSHARAIATELHGLGSDQCSNYHLVQNVASALNAEIAHLVIRQRMPGVLCGLLQLETTGGVTEIPVNIATAVALAIHLSIPILWEGSKASNEKPAAGEIPKAFRKVIEGLRSDNDEREAMSEGNGA